MPKETDIVREIVDIIHYENRDERTESSLFRKNKEWFKENGVKCFIDNGECEGQIEIHHKVIEYATANEVDWDKIEKEYGFRDVDDIKNLMPICKKHHTGKGTGIHSMSYPAWILQKYYVKDSLTDFEAAIKKMKEEK